MTKATKADRARKRAAELRYYDAEDEDEKAELERRIAHEVGMRAREQVRKALESKPGRGAPGAERKRAEVESLADVKRWLDGEGPQTIRYARECVLFVLERLKKSR